jgi:gluconate 5-dehydrogenase
MFTCKYFGNWMKSNNIEGAEKVADDAFEHGKANPNQGYGKIINFGSVRGIRAVANGGNGNVPYNTTKGAVEMLTKAFAADLRPNIQVNAIGPTITYTPMMVGLLPPDEKTRNGIAGSLPAQRIGYEIDVVGPAIFLASAASDMVTATTIYPDGGLVATS